MKMDEIRKLQMTVNIILAMITPICWHFDGEFRQMYLLYVLFPVYYLAIVSTFFADTKNVMVIDPQDNIYFYGLRFFPFYLLLFCICYQAGFGLKLLFLFISLVYTRNLTIKDEYRRFISLIIFVYFVRNILINDFVVIIMFLWWYQIILWNSDRIIFSLPEKYLVKTLYIYMRYFFIKKMRVIGIVFNVLLFSTPFFFYYFFDQRILGIVLINMLLTLLLIARIFYSKTISAPQYALKMCTRLPVEYCELYFTAVTTLMQYEIEPLKEVLMENDSWIVYIEYENHREKIRDMILEDLNKMGMNTARYLNPPGLEQDLTRYFELAELPFSKLDFISNKNNLLDYESIENNIIFEDEKFRGLAVGLLANNSIEVRVKNPLYFVGFFSESKFFLRNK